MLPRFKILILGFYLYTHSYLFRKSGWGWAERLKKIKIKWNFTIENCRRIFIVYKLEAQHIIDELLKYLINSLRYKHLLFLKQFKWKCMLKKILDTFNGVYKSLNKSLLTIKNWQNKKNLILVSPLCLAYKHIQGLCSALQLAYKRHL